jgi:hypothetical protein
MSKIQKNFPIVFFHKGDSWYLKYTLSQARYHHPNSEVYLLGDASNSHYPFVTHVDMSRYEIRTLQFRRLYQHRNNSTPFEYELFCFLRWFYVLGLAREKQWNGFIYLDSDVLVFANFENVETLFNSYSIANTGAGVGVPAFTFFKDCQAIEDFCAYQVRSYCEPALMDRLAGWWTNFQEKKGIGGICDMTLFDFYFKDNPEITGKLDKVGLTGFDNSISTKAGYESQGDIKKVYWKKQYPYFKWLETGELVQFVNIHYQGSYKYLIPGHYNAGGFFLARLVDLIKQQYLPKSRLFLRNIRNRKNLGVLKRSARS